MFQHSPMFILLFYSSTISINLFVDFNNGYFYVLHHPFLFVDVTTGRSCPYLHTQYYSWTSNHKNRSTKLFSFSAYRNISALGPVALPIFLFFLDTQFMHLFPSFLGFSQQSSVVCPMIPHSSHFLPPDNGVPLDVIWNSCVLAYHSFSTSQ